MDTKPIKKTNIAYVLVYIFVPILLLALGFFLIWMFFRDGGTGAVILFLAPFLFAMVWYILGGGVLYNRKRKKLPKELDKQGFTRNYTFNADGCTVAIDVEHGQVAMLFRWNPFAIQVAPAKRITKVWVDDGKGLVGGSRRVSFLFLIDSVKVRVNTFTSNQSWAMNSDYILTAISKADMSVEALNAARSRSLEG